MKMIELSKQLVYRDAGLICAWRLLLCGNAQHATYCFGIDLASVCIRRQLELAREAALPPLRLARLP